MPCSGGRVRSDRVRGEHRLRSRGRRRFVTRVYLREFVALEDGIAPLGKALDTDRMVDRVRLGAPSGTELERRDTHGERAHA